MTSSKFPRAELLSTPSLIANPDNARIHTDEQVTKIAASINRYGFVVPIVVDRNNMIASGHGRWLAAQKLGLTEVPVVRAEFVTEEDRRSFVIADNRLAEMSSWEFGKLTSELEDLHEKNFDIDAIGFSLKDLDNLTFEPAKPAKGMWTGVQKGPR